MARYQLRRPSPIKVTSRIKRWQTLGPSGALFARQETKAPEEEEEKDEGPESPDSPESSPSSAGNSSSDDYSSSDDEDSEEDEPPSATKSGASPASSQAPGTLGPAPTSTMSSRVPVVSGQPLVISGQTAQTTSSKSSAAALPQVTDARYTSSTATRLPTTITTIVFSSKIARPTQPATESASQSSSLPSGISRPSMAEPETDAPRKTSSRPEPTLMSKGAEAAAITLSIFGALALLIGALFFYKRRKRLRSEAGHTDNTFNPDNSGSLRAPEVVHIDNNPPIGGGGSHLTRSTERSNTLFGPSPYIRPETVSSDAGRSRVAAPQPTPNPFVDPPLNKAYDVLAGRPRSTTLTDRGSWVQNPFKDPESDRFDPFGELQAKARMERVKYMEQARREAERNRRFE